MDEWWERSGLPPAERQYRVRIQGRTFIIDRAIVDLKVAVEWNGFRYHGDPTGFDRDADKQLALVSARWIYLPVTTNTAPEAVCRAVAAPSPNARNVGARTPARPPGASSRCPTEPRAGRGSRPPRS